MRISDWSSDVCSSDLFLENFANIDSLMMIYPLLLQGLRLTLMLSIVALPLALLSGLGVALLYSFSGRAGRRVLIVLIDFLRAFPVLVLLILIRSEEHTSELQSLMRISYAVFCLKKKKKHK